MSQAEQILVQFTQEVPCAYYINDCHLMSSYYCQTLTDTNKGLGLIFNMEVFILPVEGET